jgi:iron(III) transport system substrate-binding protein
MEPAIARATAEGLARNAPHPHAALLFFDFLISDAQPILAARQFFSTSRQIEPPYKGPVKLIDSAALLDEARKWQDLFQRTIIGPSR